MNLYTLKKNFFLFVVILSHSLIVSGGVELSHYAKVYKKLTTDENGQDTGEPVDIFKLYSETGRLSDEEEFKETSKIRIQWQWSTVFNTMKSYGIAIRMLRVAERAVCASDIVGHLDRWTRMDKLQDFCAIFTYCVQRQVITDDDIIIQAIEKHTCSYSKEDKKYQFSIRQLPYVATIISRIEDRYQIEKDVEKQISLRLFQKNFLQLFFLTMIDVDDRAWLEIINTLKNNNSCSDIQDRLDDLKKLKDTVQKVNFVMLEPKDYEKFQSQFFNIRVQQSKDVDNPFRKKLVSLKEQKRARRRSKNFYLTLMLTSGALAVALIGYLYHNKYGFKLPYKK